MIRAIVVSKWTKGTDGYFVDAVKFLQPGDSLMDYTGEPNVDRHTVNPVVVELWCSKKTLSDIEKDYGADAILAYEPYDPEADKNEGKKDPVTKAKAESVLTALCGKAVTVAVVDGTVKNVCECIKARPADKTVEAKEESPLPLPAAESAAAQAFTKGDK